MTHRSKNKEESMNQIDPPVTLSDLFGRDSDDDEEIEEENCFCYQVQNYNLRGKELKIRQYAFHSHNANQVWPGTFNLCDYLLTTFKNSGSTWGDILELGSATGILAIRLSMEQDEDAGSSRVSFCSRIVTSDVQEEDGSNQVEENIQHNFKLNGFRSMSGNDEDIAVLPIIPLHLPHLWGTNWDRTAVGRIPHGTRFDTVIASDILLYVSAYPALVQTLKELLDPAFFPLLPIRTNGSSVSTKNPRFVMSWNRRMKESAQFFDLMTDAGFQHQHEGKCVYTFWKEQ